MTPDEQISQLREQLMNANDRITVLGNSLVQCINESTAAKADNLRLNRLVQSLSVEKPE